MIDEEATRSLVIVNSPKRLGPVHDCTSLGEQYLLPGQMLSLLFQIIVESFPEDKIIFANASFLLKVNNFD